jgi:acyl-coenzyme A synthetase/AMP-(fatty) acid ligase
MSILRSELEKAPATAIVIAADCSKTRSDILRSATALSRQLRHNCARRVFIQSDDPSDLLTALVVCPEQGIDLLIGHRNMDSTQRNQLLKALQIDMVLDRAWYTAETDIEVCKETSAESAGAILLMTSGTTGRPKVVKHKLSTLLGRIFPSASLAAYRDSRWLLTYQATAFAGIQVILTACVTGGAVVIPHARTASAFAESAQRHRVTHMSGTPTFWRSFLLACRSVSLPDLVQITIGGEAVDQATLDRLSAVFPKARISHIYASTEAGALFAIHDKRPGFPASWLDNEVQGVRLRMRNGQLEVQSPRRMVGYASQHDDLTTGDGWLATGDLVCVEGDRVLFMGRNDLIINVGGSKVSPQEIETFLLGLPNIAETKVKAVKSPITGQVIVAEIVVTPGADPETVRKTTIQGCRENLARHKIPSVLRVVPCVAVNDSGKKA